MIRRARSFILAHLLTIVATLLALSVAVNAWFAVKVYGFKVGPFGFEGLQHKADMADVEVKFARETAQLSESLRGQEQSQGIVSFTGASQRCDQRVATASKAARIIEEITNGNDVGASPQADRLGAADSAGDRGIVDAGRLRIIIGQDAEAQAVGLPSGTDDGAPIAAPAS